MNAEHLLTHFDRIAFGPGYRLYYGREGSTLVILLGVRMMADCER